MPTPEKLPLLMKFTPNNGQPLKSSILAHPALQGMTRTEKRAQIHKARKVATRLKKTQ